LISIRNSGAPRTLVCDLDGTLADTLPDLADALNRTIVARGLPPYTEPEVMRMVGDGVHVLVERAFAGRGQTPDAAATADYVADYGANVAVRTRLFPGIAEALATLEAAGWNFALCTNKPERPSRSLLAALGIDHYFAAVGGGDSFPTRKPDPKHLLATLAAAGGTPARALMVGDNHNDVAAAAGLGMQAIFAAWGYCPREAAAGAAAIAERTSDLPTICERLLP
jgi:phosphoglycolate phosphatase